MTEMDDEMLDLTGLPGYGERG
jgi:spermidine/putrescine transport system ATP-binding protein